jgi:hypothetical protein
MRYVVVLKVLYYNSENNAEDGHIRFLQTLVATYQTQYHILQDHTIKPLSHVHIHKYSQILFAVFFPHLTNYTQQIPV